jgi:asparagine synthase (glutamine-hydrolysing)
MCGIAGVITKSKDSAGHIKSITSSLSHRGPDFIDYYVNEDNTVSLGHTRLSILDLSENANQPFRSSDGRYVMVYNGEIFNYRQVGQKLTIEKGTVFKTTSDTEVIIEAFAHYGMSIVNLFEGMFALAILDKANNDVYFLRDRLGKKPLYYYYDNDLFVFASELKSILCHPVISAKLTVCLQSIFRFLHLGYVPEPDTIYEGIKKFPAGSWGKIDKNLTHTIHSFWDAQDYVHKGKAKDVTQSKNELTRLLEVAVSDRLISDVPVGAFLSGGIDSSLVCAIATKFTSEPIKTFSIGFDENKFDESAYARNVAEHLGTEHFDFRLSEQDAISILDTYIKHFDEPFYDTSAIPTMLVSKLARKYVKVALTGDGGDELFQGYGAYIWAERLSNVHRGILAPLSSVLNFVGRQQQSNKIKQMLEPGLIGGIQSHIYSQEQGLFTQREIADLLVDTKTYDPFYPNIHSNLNNLRPSEKQAIFDLKYYLKDDLLVKVDRSSMYYGLECRCPLLDHRVVEYALGLDYSLKIRRQKSKWILRQILKDYFPLAFFERRKQGFSIPLKQWLKGELRYLIDDFLNQTVVESVGLVQFPKVKNLVQRFNQGEDYVYTRIWVLILLHKWLLTFRNNNL